MKFGAELQVVEGDGSPCFCIPRTEIFGINFAAIFFGECFCEGAYIRACRVVNDGRNFGKKCGFLKFERGRDGWLCSNFL